MSIKATLFFVSLIISALLCGQTLTHKFIISGQVQGFESGTIIYLNDLSEGYYKIIDSTAISDKKFHFSGNLRGKYLKASLTSFDYDDRVTLWLEKGITSFVGKRGDFLNAAIKGSIIQRKWNELNDLLDTAKNAEQAEYLFIKQNPNSIIAAHNLSRNLKTWDKDSISKLYKLFSKEVKQTAYAKKILNFIALNKDIKLGNRFVDFSQSDTSNRIVKLSDFKDKIVLLEFWGSWCVPCREKNSELLKIYNAFRTKGFEILGVASETDRIQWIKAIKKDSLTWTNVSDLNGSDNKAAMIYGVTDYPTNFLIDKTGTIIAKDVYSEDLQNLLSKLLR
jgi:peroxiredoxin